MRKQTSMGLGKKKSGKGDPLVLEILQGPSGSWFWRLKSANNRILAFSEMYSSHHAAERAAKMVWDNMRPSTIILDRRDSDQASDDPTC